MIRLTRGLMLGALMAPVAAFAQDQGTSGNGQMTCADFLTLDTQTQGTVLLQVQAGTPGSTPDSAPGGSAETAIGGGAGLDGSPGTQSGATPDATGGGTTTGAAPEAAPETPPTNEGIQGTGSESGSGSGEGMAVPAMLESVTAHCRDTPTATVAAAVQAAGGQPGEGGTAN